MSKNASLYRRGCPKNWGGIPKMMSQIWLSPPVKNPWSKLEAEEIWKRQQVPKGFAMDSPSDSPWLVCLGCSPTIRWEKEVWTSKDLGHTSQTTIIWEYLGGFPKMGGPENQRTPYWKWQLLHDQSGSPIKKTHVLPWVDKFWNNHDWLTLILRWQIKIFLQGIHYYNYR